MASHPKQLIPSWSLLAPNIKLLQKFAEHVIVLVLLPSLLADLGNAVIAPHNQHIGLGLAGLGTLWALTNIGASYYMQTIAVSSKTASLGECYQKGWHYFWRLFSFAILFTVMLVVGLVLLIVPGLIVLRRYFLTFFYIVDEDLSIKAAMQRSSHATKPVAGSIWGIIGVIFVINFLALALANGFHQNPGIGLVITSLAGLLYLFLPALRYREIKTS